MLRKRSWPSTRSVNLSTARRLVLLRALATDESQGRVRAIFGGVVGRGPVVEGLRTASVRSVLVEVAWIAIRMALFARQMSSPGLSAWS